VFGFTVLNVTTEEHVIYLSEGSAMFEIQITSKKEVRGTVL